MSAKKGMTTTLYIDIKTYDLMTSLIKHRHIRGRSSFINEAIEHYLEHKLPEFEHVEKARDAYNIQLQINALN